MKMKCRKLSKAEAIVESKAVLAKHAALMAEWKLRHGWLS